MYGVARFGFLFRVAGCLLFSLAGTQLAWTPNAKGQQETRATAIVLQQGELTLSERIRVDMGIRDGMRDRQGVRYVYAADALSVAAAGEELADALEQLEAFGASLGDRGWRVHHRKAMSILQTLRDNLSLVKRGDLAKSMALVGVTACGIGKKDLCHSTLRDVFSFRLGFRPEEQGIPDEFSRAFDRALREVQLAPLQAITLLTEPPGLEVFVDGRSLGPSPADVDVTEGLHYITVRGFGYDKLVTEIRVDSPDTFSFEPVTSERALLVERERDGLLDEMGFARAGPITSGMASYLSVSQVALGSIEEGTTLRLSLYDLRTKGLLGEVSGELDANDLEKSAAELARRLYEGVDLQGALELVDDDDGGSAEIYEQWWFWTGVGAIVLGGTITAIVLGSGSDPEVPEGTLRLAPRLD